MQAEETARTLKRWAVEEGFTRAGVASLEPSRNGDFYRRWLAAGNHAEMAWMERRIELRENPADLLPEARSALVVALQYHPLEGEDEPEGDLWPRVARYARGRDYHDIMGRGLKALARRIEEAFPGRRSRPYVDTGPILERELAARAGLGAVGKHTNLLHRQWGSWFLLGELFLDLELTPDPPISDLCGRCTRCLEACPTEALPAPYHLDSNRCISYWTIEHRGDLPEAVRPMLEDWVFGCDLCQEACPYSDRPRSGEPLPGTEPRLRLPPQRRELDLAGLLRLDREGYVERFQVSPMKRAKLEGLQRNAAVAMGNRRDPAYVEPLEATLRDGETMVRRHAAWALGQIADGPALAALEQAATREDDPSVQREIDSAITRLQSAAK